MKYDFISESYDDLLRKRHALLEDARNMSNGSPVEAGDDEVAETTRSEHPEADLNNFYRQFYMRKFSEPAYSPNEWRWLEGVRSLSDELQKCLSNVADGIDGIEKENNVMVSELAGLDEKSKKLLSEQSAIEKHVTELEAKMITVNAIRDVTSIINNRDLIITDFPLFERSIKGLEEALAYVASTPDQVLALSRQLETLRSKMCSTCVYVCTSAIDTYCKRMQLVLSTDGTINTSVLYNRHTETLSVVGKICEVLRSTSGDRRDYVQALSDIEKSYFEYRSKILVPVIDSFMRQTMSIMKLSQCVRKTVYFVNSIIDQEMSLFKNFLAKSTPPTMHNFLLRDVAASLYNPLRTSLISCMDLHELRESAEIIRLEIVPDKTRGIHPFIVSLVFKLHRDIQERLIYRIESYIRDEIRTCDSAEILVEKTKECLSIITGVLDPETFHEISSEALSACVDVLLSSRRIKDEKGTLKLISQLLQLRERVTLIDCEYSLMAVSSPLFDSSTVARPGMTDTIKRLVNSNPNSGTITPVAGTSVRVRIESDLRILCDEFSAIVIATIMTYSEDEKIKIYLKEIHKLILEIFSNDESIESVLTVPIITELKTIATVSPTTIADAESIFSHVDKSSQI